MSEERELHEEDSRWRKSGGNDRKETKAKTISIGRDEVWGYKASKREPEMYMTVKDVVTIGDRAVAKKEVDNVDDRGINRSKAKRYALELLNKSAGQEKKRHVKERSVVLFMSRIKKKGEGNSDVDSSYSLDHNTWV